MDVEDIIATCANNCFGKNKMSELGIYRFAKMFFPNIFSHDFSEVHYIMAELLFRLLDPSKEYVMQKQTYFMVHREAAKSTVGSFLFPTYLIYLKGHDIYVNTDLLGWDDNKKQYHKELMLNDDIVKIPIDENFILIASETLRRAEGFISSIKTTIESRNDLARIFGDKDPRVIEDYEDRRRTHHMWRVNSFITADNTIIWAIGSGQHTRGLNINGRRPSLIICDDMYSQENTKTEENRKKLEYWFDAELINSADSRQGKILYLGTLVHPDTVWKDIVKSKNWYGIQRPIISMDELQEIIKRCMKDGDFDSPSVETCKEWDRKLKTLSWADHKGSYFILNKYYEFFKKRRLDSFYQEFMNEPIAPETRMISPDSFVSLNMEIYNERNKQMIEFVYEGMKWKGELWLWTGLDIASSIANTSDDSVMVTAGYCRCYPSMAGYDVHYFAKDMPKGKIFPVIIHIQGGKYAVTDYQNIPGMTEALMRLSVKYRLQSINAETQGQQEAIVREIRKNFEELDQEAVAIRMKVFNNGKVLNTSIWNEVSSQKKEERILSILLPVVQRYGKILCNSDIKDIPRLYNQLLTVGYADHDDYPDAYALCMKNAEPPPIDDDIQRELTGNLLRKYNKNREDALFEEYGDDWIYYI